MNGMLSKTDCDGQMDENTQLNAERSEFLWTLAWAGEFIADYMPESAKARTIYGQINELLGKSEEGRHVRDCVDDPRNRSMELEAA
jgi:hypothetical protein